MIEKISNSVYNDAVSVNLKMLSAYSGGYPFSISGDIRSVPS